MQMMFSFTWPVQLPAAQLDHYNPKYDIKLSNIGSKIVGKSPQTSGPSPCRPDKEEVGFIENSSHSFFSQKEILKSECLFHQPKLTKLFAIFKKIDNSYVMLFRIFSNKHAYFKNVCIFFSLCVLNILSISFLSCMLMDTGSSKQQLSLFCLWPALIGLHEETTLLPLAILFCSMHVIQ